MVRLCQDKDDGSESVLKNSVIEELAKAERNKYAREWRAKNKDKVKENNARYWARRALKAQKEAAEDDSK